MKNKVKTKRKVLGILVLLLGLSFSINKSVDVQAYTQMSQNLIAICDQYNSQVIVYNADTHAEYYKFKIPNVTSQGYKIKTSPVDVKLRKHNKSGKNLLLVTTGKKLYIVDYSNKKVLKTITYDFTDGINVHSIDMSPDGTICVAEPNSGIINFYKLSASFKVSECNYYYNNDSAHSVLYDAEKKVFWVAGNTQLFMIPIASNGTVGKTASVYNYNAIRRTDNNTNFINGHCMIQNPNDSNELIISGYNGVINFKKDTGALSWRSGYYGIKGIVLYNNKLYYVRKEDDEVTTKSWNTTKLRLDGKAVWTFPGKAQVYKIVPFCIYY